MNIRIFAAPAIVLFAVLFAQTANAVDEQEADDAPENIVAMLKSLDTDHNGFISAEEAKANPAVAEAFEDADTDGDGQLSMSELVKMDISPE